MSRVHQLGRMRLIDLITTYQQLTGNPVGVGQAIRWGYHPATMTRDQLIAAIRETETQPKDTPS